MAGYYRYFLREIEVIINILPRSLEGRPANAQLLFIILDVSDKLEVLNHSYDAECYRGVNSHLEYLSSIGHMSPIYTALLLVGPEFLGNEY